MNLQPVNDNSTTDLTQISQTSEPMRIDGRIRPPKPSGELDSELCNARFVQGVDFFTEMRDPQQDASIIVGIPDESKARAIQAAIASRCTEISILCRGISGKDWGVWCSTYDSKGRKSSDSNGGSLEYWSGENDSVTLKFFPWLIDAVQRARELLMEADFSGLHDFKAIDTDHERCGIEVGGITDLEVAQEISRLLLINFPEFKHLFRYYEERANHDPGWHVRLHALVDSNSDEEELGGPITFQEFDLYQQWKVVVGYAVSRFFTESQLPKLFAAVAELRAQLNQFGVCLPVLKFRDDLNLQPNSVRLEVDEKVLRLADQIYMAEDIINFLGVSALTLQRMKKQ